MIVTSSLKLSIINSRKKNSKSLVYQTKQSQSPPKAFFSHRKKQLGDWERERKSVCLLPMIPYATPH